MKTVFEYIVFVPEHSEGKTSKWSMHNRRSSGELGLVMWYVPWRQYCYFPTTPAVYSAGCLKDIQEFIEGLKP